MIGKNTRRLGRTARPKRFFAYYKAEDRDRIDEQRARCRALVAGSGGVIVGDAADVGPGVIVDMPGYADLYEALDRGTVDSFVADMRAFGPTMILGLFAMCAVNGIEMWDLAGGRVTDAQIRAVGEALRHRLGDGAGESKETIRDMLGPKNPLS